MSDITKEFANLISGVFTPETLNKLLSTLDKKKDAEAIQELSSLASTMLNPKTVEDLMSQKDISLQNVNFTKQDTYAIHNPLSLDDAIRMLNETLNINLDVNAFKLPVQRTPETFTKEDLDQVQFDIVTPAPTPFQIEEVVDLSCDIPEPTPHPFTQREVEEMSCEIPELEGNTLIDPVTGQDLTEPVFSLASVLTDPAAGDRPSIVPDVPNLILDIPELDDRAKNLENPKVAPTANNRSALGESLNMIENINGALSAMPGLTPAEKVCIATNLEQMSIMMKDTQTKLERKEVIDNELVSLKKEKMHLEVLKEFYLYRYSTYAEIFNDLSPKAKQTRIKDEEVEAAKASLLFLDQQYKKGEFRGTNEDYKKMYDDRLKTFNNKSTELKDLKSKLKVDKSNIKFSMSYSRLFEFIQNNFKNFSSELVMKADTITPLYYEVKLKFKMDNETGIFKTYNDLVKALVKDADTKNKAEALLGNAKDAEKTLEEQVEAFAKHCKDLAQSHEVIFAETENFFFQNAASVDNRSYLKYLQDRTKYQSNLKTLADKAADDFNKVDMKVKVLEIEVDLINKALENLEERMKGSVTSCTVPDTGNTANQFFDPINNKQTDIHPTSPLEMSYWQKFCQLATIVNLIPAFWPIGLLVPTPATLLKVPMPIIWKPIVVIPTPFLLIGFFIGICGVMPSPFMMILNMTEFTIGPVKPHAMWFPMAIRPMQKIKEDVESKVIPAIPKIKINGGEIDINPTLSMSLPYYKDDLPRYHRLKLTNLPFMLFLLKWCKAGKKGGGFFENP